jgi:hypothetical protein
MSTPPPVVVALAICRDVIRESATGNYSDIRSFSGQAVGSFPGTTEPFCILASLTDGRGVCRSELVVTYFGATESFEYARLPGQIQFPDPLQLVECVYRFDKFPVSFPGVYLFTLLLNGRWAAQKSLRVYLREGTQ